MDNSILINKIISIVVALVVAVTVLVPIAGSVGGGSGNGGSSIPDYSDIATPLKEFSGPMDIDLTKYEDGEIIFWTSLQAFYRVSETQIQSTNSSSAINLNASAFTITAQHEIVTTSSPWGSIYNAGPSGYWVNDGAENATHWLITDVDTALPAQFKDSANIFVRLAQSTGPSSYTYQAVELDTSGTVLNKTYSRSIDNLTLNPESVKLSDISINVGPKYPIADNSNSKQSGILFEVGEVPVDDGNDESDSGIIGTLVQLIPIFVILAILLSAVTMVTGKKDNNLGLN